jgi:hypothetical protein
MHLFWSSNISSYSFFPESPQSNINIINFTCALLFSTPRKDHQSTGVVHVWQFICLLFTEHLGHWMGAKHNLACFFPQQLSEIHRVTNLAIFLLLLWTPLDTKLPLCSKHTVFSMLYFFQMWLNHFVTMLVKNVSNTFSTDTQRR